MFSAEVVAVIAELQAVAPGEEGGAAEETG